jgi:hypothetical protein
MPRFSLLALVLLAAACAPSAPTVDANHPAREGAPTASAIVEVAAIAPAPQPILPTPLRDDSRPPGGSTDAPVTMGMDHAGMDHSSMVHGSMDAKPDVDPAEDRHEVREAMAGGAVSARDVVTAGHSSAAPMEHAMPMEHGDAGTGSALTDALDAYLAVQAALAADHLDAPAAQAFAVAFEAATDEMPEDDPHFWHARPDEVTAVREAAQALAAAGDIEAARLAFGQLSVPFAALLTTRGVPEGYDLARFTCGMARGVPGGGVWLQRDGELRNPYFGAAMLTCGRRDGALPTTSGERPMDHGDADHGSMDHESMGHDGHRP